MSLTKRIIDLARSNLNKLLEQAAATADPRRRLSGLSDEELEAELSRRRAARQAEAKIDDAKKRIEDDRARARGEMPKDRETRERMARERAERVKRERAARAAAGSASGSTAGRTAPRGGSGSTTGGARTPPPRQPPPPRAQNQDLARYYARLEVPYGSGWEDVKTAYRRLMRKYHPDLHAGKSPEKVKAANEVAAALTQAYNELERHLKGGPNRSV